jgi:hypothetical protein
VSILAKKMEKLRYAIRELLSSTTSITKLLGREGAFSTAVTRYQTQLHEIILYRIKAVLHLESPMQSNDESCFGLHSLG